LFLLCTDSRRQQVRDFRFVFTLFFYLKTLIVGTYNGCIILLLISVVLFLYYYGFLFVSTCHPCTCNTGLGARELSGFQEFGPRYLSVYRLITVNCELRHSLYKLFLRLLRADKRFSAWCHDDASQWCRCMSLCALAYYSATDIWTIINTPSSRSLRFLLLAPDCVNLFLWIQLWQLVF